MPSYPKIYGLFSVYLLGFLFSLLAALPNYVNSSYLGTLMSEQALGVIYTLEAVLAIIGFLLMPIFLRKFGNFRVAIFLFLCEGVSLLGLTIYHNILVTSFFMICNLTLLTFLYFSLDIFLEEYSHNVSTGKTRGIYLTSVNLAWAASPYLTGLILIGGEEYWRIYLVAFLILVPAFVVLRLTLADFKDSNYQTTSPVKTLALIRQTKNIFNIIGATFLLQIFYSWMIIYTPIYLNTNLGLSWGSIGIIFSIMLLPFIFIQFPAGKIADSWLGEKEMLTAGFIIMGVSSIAMYFIVGKSILVWSLVLLCTRVGAATVEIMCDTYFFKKVDNQNANLISYYRMARPLAYIIGPLLAIVILSWPGFGIKNLFLILGILMFLGLKFSLSLQDTK